MCERQKIIDKENEKLKKISPDLKIGSVVMYKDQITSMGISIPIKGNAKKIKQLEADGWKKHIAKSVWKITEEYLGVISIQAIP